MALPQLAQIRAAAATPWRGKPLLLEENKNVKRMVLSCIIVTMFAFAVLGKQTRQIPAPLLVLTGQESIEANNKQYQRYHFEIFNRADFPEEMFSQAPDLPACGSNKNASRTWVDIYKLNGERLNGFCAITDRAGLKDIWFAMESGVVPPSWVYIELLDRRTNVKYKSNLAETTL